MEHRCGCDYSVIRQAMSKVHARRLTVFCGKPGSATGSTSLHLHDVIWLNWG